MRVGATITAQPGTWIGPQPIRFGYQWRICNAKGGSCNFAATGRTFQLRPSDAGHTFRVFVRASSGSGGGATVVYLSYALSDATGAVGPIASGPANTAAPTIAGTARQGETLTAQPGSWRGVQPIHFSYQWQRCGHDGRGCENVHGATGQTFRLEHEDVAHTLRVAVLATNQYGRGSALSGPTDVVAEAPPPPPPAIPGPANTVVPTLTGSAVQGSTLTANPGTWQGPQPISIAYQWDRCDANVKSCPAINGATGRTYTLTSADIGQRLLVQVTAKNAGGTSVARSAPSAVVQAPPPPPTTTKFMPATQVALPSRLVVDNLQFNPSRLTSRSAPFVARFHVSDVNSGRAVAGALVYAVGVPFNRLSNQPEAITGQDGWATITFRVQPTFQLRKGNLLTMFVRARKPGGSLLAGVSSRRLVALRVG
jgi:hypothetical protein